MAPSTDVLHSQIDASVNFVTTPDDARGLIEARFVRRSPEYFIAYLSSQTGCNKGCRMCHLTQTAQTQADDVTVEGLVTQAEQVLDHYDTLDDPADTVHFNFMARGEPFANTHVRNEGDRIVDALLDVAGTRNLLAKMKFSTIMPRELEDVAFTDMFRRHQPDIYYSLYSTDPEVRRRWLPRALDVTTALTKLVDWQQATSKIPTLHWAFIAGVNDDPKTMADIIDAVNSAGLRADVNIVRYNPASPHHGEESPEETLHACAAQLTAGIAGTKVKVVSRVGLDVAASCGMFVGGRPVAIRAR